MSRFVTAGLGFLLAVLWFDLMFDVQTRGHTGDLLPAEVLTSISTYYRHVTTEAYPMNRLVSSVMMLTMLALCAEIYEGKVSRWISCGTLALMCFGVYSALTTVVPNAVRLGAGTEGLIEQTELARAIYRDHAFAFARTLFLLVLQLAAPSKWLTRAPAID
jgi:hypothetical protein